MITSDDNDPVIRSPELEDEEKAETLDDWQNKGDVLIELEEAKPTKRSPSMGESVEEPITNDVHPEPTNVDIPVGSGFGSKTLGIIGVVLLTIAVIGAITIKGPWIKPNENKPIAGGNGNGQQGAGTGGHEGSGVGVSAPGGGACAGNAHCADAGDSGWGFDRRQGGQWIPPSQTQEYGQAHGGWAEDDDSSKEESSLVEQINIAVESALEPYLNRMVMLEENDKRMERIRKEDFYQICQLSDEVRARQQKIEDHQAQQQKAIDERDERINNLMDSMNLMADNQRMDEALVEINKRMAGNDERFDDLSKELHAKHEKLNGELYLIQELIENVDANQEMMSEKLQTFEKVFEQEHAKQLEVNKRLHAKQQVIAEFVILPEQAVEQAAVIVERQEEESRKKLTDNAKDDKLASKKNEEFREFLQKMQWESIQGERKFLGKMLLENKEQMWLQERQADFNKRNADHLAKLETKRQAEIAKLKAKRQAEIDKLEGKRQAEKIKAERAIQDARDTAAEIEHVIEEQRQINEKVLRPTDVSKTGSRQETLRVASDPAVKSITPGIESGAADNKRVAPVPPTVFMDPAVAGMGQAPVRRYRKLESKKAPEDIVDVLGSMQKKRK